MPLTVPGPRRPLPEPETQPLPADNPFLVAAQRLRQRDDEDEAKRRTVITTAGTELDPERAARVLRAQARSAKRGFALPATLLAEADTLDAFEKAEKAAEFNDRDFIAQAAAFAAWQGQHPANAAVTVDDLPQLANLEATARHTRHLRHRRDGVFELLDPEGRITWAGRDPYQFHARLRNIRTEQERSDELGRGMRSIYGDGAFGQFVTGALGSVALSARLLGIGSEATHEVLAGIQQAQAEWDSTWSADFQRGAGQLFADAPLMMLGGPMARAAKSLGTVAAARSTVLALAASAASPAAGRVAETLAKVAMAVPAPVAKAAGTVALTGVAVQPLALREGLATWEEHGFGHGLAAWGIETGVSAAFGRTGVERALVPGSRMLPGYRRAALALAKDMGFEAVEEVAVELAHAIYEDASGLDEDALDPAKLWRRLTVAGALGGVAGGAFNLPGAMVQALQQQDKVGDVAAALAYADQADRLAEAAGLSKTLGRAPDEAGKVLNQAAATSAWVDPEAWTTYWQSKGQDPRQKAVDALGNAKTYDEAMRAGTPLELRLGDFAAKLDDEARTHFAGELRASPDAMNRREAMERLAELEQEVDDPGATAELTSAEAARKVEDDLAQQLLATGYTEATARSTARQNALVFRTLAARWNQNRAGATPARNAWSLYQEFAGERGIHVNRDLPEILRQPVRFDIDRELARLAAGRKRAAADAADAAQGERDAAATAQREAADRALLERAAGQDGDALIALAIERLQTAPGTLTPSGAIAWLGAEFGQRPDAGWRLTDEQRATGDMLAAALRVRGADLRLLIEDAGKAKPDPVATTATAAPAPTQDATREAELDRLVGVAGNLHALYMEATDTRNASALSDARYATLVEQMGILAAEVAPRLAELPVDPARRDEFAAAVEFAQKEGKTLQQGEAGPQGKPPAPSHADAVLYDVGNGRSGDLPIGQEADGPGRAEARRRRYDAPGQTSFLDPEVQAEQDLARGDTRPLDDKALSGLLNGLGGELKPGDRVSRLVSGIANDDIATAVLRGAVVKGPADAAALLAAYRSPFVERAAWLLLGKDGTVKHNGLYAIGTIDAVDMPDAKQLDEILAKIQTEPGDTMVWSHNHPSGDPTPSPADMRVYARISEDLRAKGMGFMGMVLNGVEFSHGVGMGQFDLTPGAREVYDAGAQFHKGLPGAQLKGPDAVASWVKSLSASPGSTIAIHTDPQLRVVGVEAWQQAPQMGEVKASREAVAGAQTFIVSPGSNPYGTRMDPRVPDIVVLKNDGYYESQRAIGAYNPGPNDYDGKIVNVLRQPAFHGTGNPDPYDRFRYDRVGGPGGEGAQVYGWGLYFASRKEVAKWYRNVLSTKVNSEALSEPPQHIADIIELNDNYGFDTPGEAILAFKGESDWANTWSVAPADAKMISSFLADVSGKLYTVEIPEDSEMLDWDKPLSEQPAHVQKAIESLFKKNRDERFLAAVKAYDAGDTKAMKAAGFNVFDYPGATGGLYKRAAEIIAEDRRMSGQRSQKEASDFLRANGVPGIKYLDQMSRGADAGTSNYVIFDDSRVDIKSYEQESRGSITFKPGDIAIRLGQSADLSTFLHESGHLYLELMGWMAAKPDAPADITKDAAAILAWLGVERFDQIEVKHHEQFARGYEAYLMEGKAPSAETRGLFARFQVWLTAVYKSVRALGVDLTPEIRGVFDRLLATEAEIAAAQEELAQTPLAQHADALGLDPAQRDELLRLTEAARIEAQERLTDEARREIERERSAAWRDLTEAMRLEVELEINRQPAYIAQSVLRRGTMPGGVPLPPEQTPAPKLNAKALRDQIAAMSKIDDERKAIRKRFNGMVSAEGGITPDDAAALFGFANGAELVQTLADLRDRAELIKAEAETRMLAKHGDIRLDGISAEVAMEATHGAKRGELHLAELRLLTQRSAPDAKGRRRVAPIEVMRAAARAKVASLPAGQVSPEVYRRAERKARRQLEEALARADFAAARAHKQAELLHHEMVRAAVEAKVTVEKAVEKLRGFTERKRREKIGLAGGWEWTVTAADGATFTAPTEADARRISERLPGSTWEPTSGYLEQIDALLERYDLTPRTGRADRKRQSLRAWVEQMVEQGRMVEIDPALVEGLERESWREMSVEQVEALRDAVLHIAHLARVKNRLSKLQKERDEAEAAAELVQTLAETHPEATPPDAATPTPGVWRRVGQFIAAHRKAANLLQVFDGLERGGAWWQTFVRPMNEASDREQVIMRDHGDRLNALWSTWRTATANDGWKANIKRQFDGFTGGLNRIEALMVALNWGNEGNRTRLMTGHKVDQAQVEAVLESLEEADWTLVQAVWDQINEFKSEVGALEQRVTGIPPPMVEAEPVATRFGTYRGGYFPVVYDADQGGLPIDPAEADLAKAMMAQAYGRAVTKHGHAKARLTGMGKPLLLNPDVIGRHIRQVAHDLTHREALNDAARLMARGDIQQALAERTGPDTARQIRAWMVDIAQSSRPMDPLSVAQSWFRRGTSLSTMAFNVTTAAIQVTGVMQSAAYVGPGRMLGAIRRIWGSTPEGAETWAQFINDKSAFMRERARTMTRELREAWEQSSTSTAGRALLEVQRASYFMTTWMQTQVDRPTWLAAYDRALAQGQDDASSVAIADQAVIDAQGSGAQKDLSAIQRSPMGGWFTAYMTFFAARYNMTADALSIPARRDPAFVMKAGLTLLTLYPGIMLTDALIRSGLRPEAPDDEDKDGKHWAAQFALDVAADAAAGFVGLREVSGALQGFAYKGPANLKLIQDANAAIVQVLQGEIDEGLVTAGARLAGAAFGLPSTQAIRTVQGLIHWIDDPSLDIRAPLFGPPYKAR